MSKASSVHGPKMESSRSAGRGSKRARKATREEQADEIVDLVLARARDGDLAAAKLVIEKHLHSPEGRKVSFELREIESVDDAARALTDVLNAFVQGKITLEEAERISKLLTDSLRVLQMKSSPESKRERERRINEMVDERLAEKREAAAQADAARGQTMNAAIRAFRAAQRKDS